MRSLKVNLERRTLPDCLPSADRVWDTFRTPEWIPVESRMSGIKIVEAVGIEEVAVHPVSRIDGGISRTNAGDQPVESREEAAARRAFGTDDPKIVTRDELLRVLGDAQSNGAKLADLARTIEALIERQWIQS
jgi:hypothetical protein